MPLHALSRRLTASAFGVLCLWAAAFGLVVVPAVRILVRIWELPVREPAERVEVLGTGALLAAGQTVLWCGLIALGATAIALVWAWWMRGLRPRARGWAMGVGLTPLLLPSYLAYAGWNLLRSPGTWLGDALAEMPPGVSVWAGKVMAIGGLVLWVWPLALIVLAPATDRISESVLEAMRSDGASAAVRARAVLRMLAGDIARAVALCALVMAGSAIPLHIAQVNTYTIWLWSELNRVGDLRGVWIASWPVLAIAVIGALFIMRLVPASPRDTAHAGGDGPPSRGRSGRFARGMWAGAAICAWAASIVAPLLLFVLSVREPAAYIGFWQDAGPALLNSVLVGLLTGCITTLVLLAAWVAVANRARDASRGGIGGPVFWLTACGLVPGVLIGTAFGQAVPLTGIALVVATHVARFAFIGALIGLWLGASEPAELRMLRRIDGGMSLRGWLSACVRPHAGLIAGMVVVAALLSLHEIESTVQVQPPGLSNLAQYLLDQLHYLREDQLAAAGATMTGIGLAGAVLAGLLLAKGARRAPEGP